MTSALARENGPYRLHRKRMPRSACAFAQSDQGLRCKLTEYKYNNG